MNNDKHKFKQLLINALGILTTLLMIVVIYIVLYLEGAVGEPDTSALTEFAIITFLAVYCKIFWYKSCESSVRSAKQYRDDRQALSDEIDETITDPYLFDEFIGVENTINYNTYMSSKVKHLTVKNYKLRFVDKWYNFWHFKNKEDTTFFLRRYILKHEHKAQKINKLSAARITSGSQCELLDDRNFSKRHKFDYIVFGTIVSLAIFGIMSLMVFQRKENIDPYVVAVKMITYIVSMIFNILSTIISATQSTKTDDYDYMRRIYKILDRFKKYEPGKQIPKVDYLILIESEAKNDIPDCKNDNEDKHQACDENCENFEEVCDEETNEVGENEVMEVNDVTNNTPVEEYVQQQLDFNILGFTE